MVSSLVPRRKRHLSSIPEASLSFDIYDLDGDDVFRGGMSGGNLRNRSLLFCQAEDLAEETCSGMGSLVEATVLEGRVCVS